MTKHAFRIGQPVRCKQTVPAYYSGYAGWPIMEFTPEMRGVVVNIAPKVRICNPPGDPRYDAHGEFLVVDFDHPEHGLKRVALNFCNARPA